MIKLRIKEKHTLGTKPFRVQYRVFPFIWLDWGSKHGIGGYGIDFKTCIETVKEIKKLYRDKKLDKKTKYFYIK